MEEDSGLRRNSSHRSSVGCKNRVMDLGVTDSQLPASLP